MKIATSSLVAGVAALAAAAAALWTPDRSRAFLKAKHLRSAHDLVDVMGVRLHVPDDGARDAPALIMIHGFGSSLQTWKPWAFPRLGHVPQEEDPAGSIGALRALLLGDGPAQGRSSIDAAVSPTR